MLVAIRMGHGRHDQLPKLFTLLSGYYHVIRLEVVGYKIFLKKSNIAQPTVSIISDTNLIF